ncbi:MAG: TonB-dependent receptor [Prolixibacteraceae bacterium]
MKLLTMLIFVGTMTVSASVYSQKTRIDLQLRNSTVKDILKSIEESSEFIFIYDTELVNTRIEKSISLHNAKIENVLNELFGNSNISYSIDDRQIFLYKKDQLQEIGGLESGLTSEMDQKTDISGTVEDSNGQPLPGVTVMVKGTNLGVTSNSDGKFKLQVSAEATTLVFSFIGMKSQEVAISGKTTINIVMEEETVGLEEVVAVGYGVTRKRDIAGAISSIKTDDVKAGVITSTAQLLQGRAAGVMVRQNNAEPGGGISVRVRGASSISSNNEPLYVIDGFQTSIGNQINPNDIASIEVLKDAASTAIYGARGANGVVIITTKKGTEGKFSIDYSYNQATKSLYNPWDLMDAQDYMSYAMKNWNDNGSQGNPPYTETQLSYTGPGTDWIGKATRVATTQNHQLSIMGGSKKLKMSIMANYLDDLGVLQNTEFNRFGTRLNLDYNLSDRVRFGTNIYAAHSFKNYITMGTNATNNNIIYAMLMSGPFSTDTDVNIFGEKARRNTLLDELNTVKFENIANTIYSTIYGEADIFKSLTARVAYTYSNDNTKSRRYYPKTTNIGLADNGQASIENAKGDNQQLDALLTFNSKLNEKANLKVIGGTTYTDYLGVEDGIYARDFSTDAFSFNNIGAAKTISGVYSSQYQRNTLSYFTRAEFVYNNKYIINASYRADGASNFGSGNKWGYFPSASAAWQIGDESFLDFSDKVLSSWKLRASYGITGNDGIGSYQSIGRFGITDVYLGGSEVQKGYFPSSPSNPSLKWETTAQINIGTDVSLLNERIQFNIDYYVKTTSDLLNPVMVPISNGGFTSMLGNNGKIENRGWEFFIRSTNIQKPNFVWTSTLNLARNKNKVLELNEGEARFSSISPQGWYNYEEYSILQEGRALSTLYGYVFDGIIQTGETYTAQPNSIAGDPKFKDVDLDGTITPKDRTDIGDGNPDVIFGMTNSFKIYDFDFSFSFDGSYGNELLNISRLMLEEEGRLRDSQDRWSPNNLSNEIPKNGYKKNAGIKYGSYINSRYVEDASYIRLQNIELGYTLPLQKWEKATDYIKGVHVFIGAQNLFTITKYTGFSPETSTNGGSSVAQGLDYNSYPAYKTFNFGAKITF